jgi:D-sedoheptulose 7-phosphate isomerase
MNAVQEILRHQPTPESFAKSYLNHLSEVFGRMDTTEIARFIEVLLSARDRAATLFFIGNGGSAATASHFVNDISIGTRSWRKPFRAVCLSDNIAGLTAIANDYGYEDVFVLPLKTQLKEGDVVVAISASGNSPNVIKAIEYANLHGAVTVGLTGFDGGKLRKTAKLAVHVPTDKGEYGPVEDVHMILDHLVHAYLIDQCAREDQL